MLLSLSATACGGRDVAAGSSDGGPEGGEATPASGGGVCCPIATDPCAACGESLGGGWAPSAAACLSSGPCDGKIGFGTDDHGCPILETGEYVPGNVCCGCLPQPEAGNPTCTESGATWTCPPPYGGAMPACPATATQGAACTVGSPSCFSCQQGAGIGCGCDASPDGGSVWMCVGAGVECQ